MKKPVWLQKDIIKGMIFFGWFDWIFSVLTIILNELNRDNIGGYVEMIIYMVTNHRVLVERADKIFFFL